MTNWGLVECISKRCLQIVFCHQSKQCELFSLLAHMYSRMHTLVHTQKGRALRSPAPGHNFTCHGKRRQEGNRWGWRWIEGGKQWWGERFELRWGRQGRGEERRTHATLHGARLLGKPRLLLFPLECRRADSQSGSSSIFATTAHKLVPKLLLRRWRKRHGERCLMLRFGNTSFLLLLPLIEGVRMHFNKTVK